MNKSILLHHSTMDKHQPRRGEKDDDDDSIISSCSASSCASSTSSSSSFDKGGNLAAARLLYQKEQQMQRQRQQRQLREALAAGDIIASPQQEDEGVATAPATKKRRRRDPPIAPVSPSRIVTTLLPNDILCGRGIHIGTQPGNIRLHEIVRSMQEQYQQSTRQAKPLVIQQIVQIAKSEGARFLRKAPRRDDKTSPENHSWEIVENEFVYQKVSHTLRNQKYQTEQKKKEGLQYSVSSSSPLHQQQHARHPPAQALQPPSISVAAEMAAVPQNLPTVAMGFRPSSSSRAAAPATGTSLDLSGISQLQLQSSFIPQQQPAATPFLQPNTGINNNLASLLIPLLLQMNGGGGSGNTLRVPPPVPIPASSQPHQPLQPFLSTLFSMVSSQQIPPNMIVPLLQAAVMHQQQAVVSSGGGVGGATTSSSSTPTANSTITTPSQQELPLQGNDPQQLNLSSSYDNQEQ